MFSDKNIEYSQESSKDLENTYLTSSSLDNNKLDWNQGTYINLDESHKKHENKLSTI